MADNNKPSPQVDSRAVYGLTFASVFLTGSGALNTIGQAAGKDDWGVIKDTSGAVGKEFRYGLWTTCVNNNMTNEDEKKICMATQDMTIPQALRAGQAMGGMCLALSILVLLFIIACNFMVRKLFYAGKFKQLKIIYLIISYTLLAAIVCGLLCLSIFGTWFETMLYMGNANQTGWLGSGFYLKMGGICALMIVFVMFRVATELIPSAPPGAGCGNNGVNAAEMTPPPYAPPASNYDAQYNAGFDSGRKE